MFQYRGCQDLTEKGLKMTTVLPYQHYLNYSCCFVITPRGCNFSAAQSLSAAVQHGRGEAAEAPANQEQRWKWASRPSSRVRWRLTEVTVTSSHSCSYRWCLPWFVFPVLFKVYCCDNTYTTIRASVAASVRELIGSLAEKLGSTEDLLLVSLGSAGGGSSHRRGDSAQEKRSSFH